MPTSWFEPVQHPGQLAGHDAGVSPLEAINGRRGSSDVFSVSSWLSVAGHWPAGLLCVMRRAERAVLSVSSACLLVHQLPTGQIWGPEHGSGIQQLLPLTQSELIMDSLVHT